MICEGCKDKGSIYAQGEPRPCPRCTTAIVEGDVKCSFPRCTLKEGHRCDHAHFYPGLDCEWLS